MKQEFLCLKISCGWCSSQGLFKGSSTLEGVSGSVPPQVAAHTSEQGHSSSTQQPSFLGALQSHGRLCWKASWSCKQCPRCWHWGCCRSCPSETGLCPLPGEEKEWRWTHFTWVGCQTSHQCQNQTGSSEANLQQSALSLAPCSAAVNIAGWALKCSQNCLPHAMQCQVECQYRPEGQDNKHTFLLTLMALGQVELQSPFLALCSCWVKLLVNLSGRNRVFFSLYWVICYRKISLSDIKWLSTGLWQ